MKRLTRTEIEKHVNRISHQLDALRDNTWRRLTGERVRHIETLLLNINNTSSEALKPVRREILRRHRAGRRL